MSLTSNLNGDAISDDSRSADLVSVVIPCYKQAHFLGDAIESVLFQTHPHSEIIVVDDGSPDDVSAVATRYPKVTYIRQENRGLPGARNTGLQHSTGTYVVFLDSDDRLLPQALGTGLAILRAQPECAFISGQHSFIDGDGSSLPTVGEQLHVQTDYYLTLLRHNYIGCPATVMYRRDVLESVGGFNVNETFKACEDYELYLRIARSFPVYCHQEVVAEYRQHGAGMSRNLDRMLESVVSVLHAQLEHIEGHRQYEEACRAGVKFYQRLYKSELLIASARSHARTGNWGRATQSMMALLRTHPQAFAVHVGRKVRLLVLGAGARCFN